MLSYRVHGPCGTDSDAAGDTVQARQTGWVVGRVGMRSETPVAGDTGWGEPGAELGSWAGAEVPGPQPLPGRSLCHHGAVGRPRPHPPGQTAAAGTVAEHTGCRGRAWSAGSLPGGCRWAVSFTMNQ